MPDIHAAGSPPALRRSDARTLALAALGGALEFYDFIIFVYFTGVLGKLFFPPDIPDWLRQLQTLGIFAAGYLVRPLGGIVMAHFGDRVGRKRMFSLSVLLMALPTLGIGLLPTYASIGLAAPLLLLLLRMAQGAAIGGEVPGAWVFVAEHVPPGRIGFACGTLTAGLTVGILLGSLTATAINSALSPEEVQRYGWRLPFLLGGVFGLVAVWLRRWLAETPVFEALRQRRALEAGLPLKTVLSAHRSEVVLGILASWVLTAGILVLILLTPGQLQRIHGLTPADTLQANSLATVGLIIGCLLYGHCCDRFGAGRSLALGSLLMAASGYVLYLGVGAQPHLLYPLYTLTGLCVGAVAAVPALIVGLFPAPVRFTGLSFSYNLAYALFGGLTPLLIAALGSYSRLAPVHYVAILGVLGCGVGLVASRRRNALMGI